MVAFRPNWGLDLWESMEPKDPGVVSTVDRAVEKLVQGKARYKAIERALAVPWFWIACAHHRESGGAFAGVMHNGERILGTGRRTSLHPEGRGPFLTWEESALDALRLQGLDRIDNPDDHDIEWTLARLLYQWEAYNGFGYIGRVNSPYVWSFTNHYDRGKFTRDHHYDPAAVDQQIGTAILLKRMMELDGDVASYFDDGLVEPEPDPAVDPMEAFNLMHANLETLVGRRVDLVIKETLR